MDVDQILQKGKEFVTKSTKYYTSQMKLQELKVQKILQKELKMFFKAKYRSRITMNKERLDRS